jgi:hypothetical protein
MMALFANTSDGTATEIPVRYNGGKINALQAPDYQNSVNRPIN